MKNVGKNVLAWVLTLLLLCGMMAVGVSAAPDSYLDIDVGETLEVTVPAAGEQYFRFVPEEDGYYVFYASGEEDTYGCLLDADEELLYASDDDNGLNFYIGANLVGGEVYYLQAFLYSDTGGSFAVTADTVTSECLMPGETATLSLPTMETVMLEFMVEEDGWYVIESASDADVYAYLLDYDLYDLIFNDDGGDDYNFSMVYYFWADELYYIEVGSVEDWTVECAVTALPIDEEDLFPEAVDIAAGDTRYVDVITTDGIACYRFVPEVSGAYEFYSESNTDPYCVFYDVAYGYAFVEDDYDYEAGWCDFGFSYEFEAGNTYYFLTAAYPDEGDYYSVTLDLSEAPDDPEYPEEEYIDIQLGDTVEITPDGEGVTPILLFVPEADGWYAFASEGEEDTFAVLYGSMGLEVFNDNDGDGYNFCIVDYCYAGVEYQLASMTYDMYGGSYAVTVDALSESELFPGSMQMQVGDSAYVDVAELEGSACYSFVPKSDGVYTFYSTGDADPYCFLYDLNLDTVVSADDYYYTGSDANYVLTYEFEAYHTYYLLTSAFIGDEIDSYYDLYLVGGDPGFARAEEIVAGEPKEIYSEYSEESRFLFTPEESGWYRFSSAGDADSYGCLLDDADFILEEDDDGGEMYNFSILYFCEADVSYCISTFAYDEEPVTYTILVEAVEGENLFPDAEEIVLGETKTVEIETENCYRFVPEADGEYTLFSSGDADAYCLVYDVNGGYILSFDDGDEDCNFEATNYFEAGETYYFVVGAHDMMGNFEITLIGEPDQPEILVGDVDGSGKINNRDLGLLQQYINEYPVTVDVDAADMDGNGKINNRDLGLLQQYINS